MAILDETYKEVYFGDYCPRCKHENLKEEEAPCSECLEHPVNEHSHKPVKFEGK